MHELELSKAFTLMESGPAVLVSTHDGKKDDIMTISWTMVMDFTPVFAITTGAWNHSLAALRMHRECIIAIPTVNPLDKVVGIGTYSGADTDKFAKFKLTSVPARLVRPPLVKECLANIECKVIDIVKKTTELCWRRSPPMLIPNARRGARFTRSVTEHSLLTGAGLTERK